MKKYDNYKDSGIEWIGEIPEHWEVTRLGFLASKIGDGLHGTPSYVDNSNFKFINGNNIDDGQISIYEHTKCVSEEEYLSNKKELNENSILMSINGTIGNLGVYKGEKVMLGKSVAYINIIDSNVLSFTYRYLESESCKTYIDNQLSGSTIKNLSLYSINKIPIPFPSIEEQTTIANYLDHKTTQIDTLISKKQQFITLLQEERIAVINQAVTKGLDPNVRIKDSGVEWLGEIPEHWEVKPLKYLVKDLLSGVSVNSHDAPINNNEEYGILKTSCVYDYTFRPIQNKQVLKEEYNRVKCSVEKDTIIISRMNTPELVGASGYVSKDYPNLFLPDRLWKTEFFNDVKINVKWLSQVLISDLYKKALSSRATGTSSSMKNISKDDFLTLQIPYCPLEEQNEIAEFLLIEASRVDEIILKAKQEIELLKEYKTALISEVVTGKVDVREEILN